MIKNYACLLLTCLICLPSFAIDSTRVKAPDSPLKDLIVTNARKYGKAKLELYVMSFCPYGLNAEKAILPIIKEMADSVDLAIFFIAREVPGASFQSLHGITEVMEDRRQLVIARHFQAKLADYLMDKAVNYGKHDWAQSARAAGLDSATLDKLVGDTAEIKAFRDNITVGNAKKINASPTLFINGMEYNGTYGPSGAMSKLECRGGPNNKQACPVEGHDEVHCPSACVGGFNNNGACSTNSDCPNACRRGAHPGAKCSDTEPCLGNCQGTDHEETCRDSSDCEKVCQGGTNDGTGCSDSSQCSGGGKCRHVECSPHECDLIGTCDMGTCAKIATPVCCNGSDCLIDVTHDDCTRTSTSNRWYADGTCNPNPCVFSNAISLPSLHAVYNDITKSVQVSWHVSSDIDNQSFYVERSRNGERFNIIASLDKTSMVDSAFDFTDIAPFQVSYYRLSFMQRGQSTHSQTITVIGVGSGQLILQSNPAGGSVRVLLNNMQLYNTAVTILDLSGRRVLSRTISDGQFELDISGLSAGVYIVRARQNGKVYTGRLIKN